MPETTPYIPEYSENTIIHVFSFAHLQSVIDSPCKADTDAVRDSVSATDGACMLLHNDATTGKQRRGHSPVASGQRRRARQMALDSDPRLRRCTALAAAPARFVRLRHRALSQQSCSLLPGPESGSAFMQGTDAMPQHCPDRRL